MYLTYEEYKGYGGTLDEPTFNSFNYEAQLKVDYYTDKRLVNDTVYTENVKRCVYKLIGLLNTFDGYTKVVTDINNPVISSQSNDGVSVSYGGYLGSTTPQDLTNVEKQLNNDIYNTIQQYLYGEHNSNGDILLYRGVR